YFIQTGFAGYIWGWITIKSRSILLAILSHNFSNFFGTLSTMIK
ncbi:MAG: CPBP family intramembrane metalloprotease, partial [Chryseobacterium sp.]|nr:CPBP family intramembrane metalloprotease [Chryseobacterium sp.]